MDTPLIITSSKLNLHPVVYILMWWPVVVKAKCEKFLPLSLNNGRSPHVYMMHRMQIQFRVPDVNGVPLETCWASNKLWNNKFYYKVSSCWLFLLIFPTYFMFPNLWVLCWSLLGERFLAYTLLTMIYCTWAISAAFTRTFFISLKIFHTIRHGLGTYCFLLQVKPMVSLEDENNLLVNLTVWSIFMTTENFVLIYCIFSQQSGIL